MALCEAAAFYKEQGLTLWDEMIAIYEKYGYYKEGAVSITLEGVEAVSYTHLTCFRNMSYT